MNCVIPGANMKIISKAVQALSKIGDELNLEPNPDHLLLRSVNMTTTAYCTYKFFDSFFSSYEVKELDDDASLNAPGCMIPMKAVLGVFKSHRHKDKEPEICRIELDYNATKIVFKLKYKHEVVVERSLYLSDGEIVTVTYNKESANQISASAQLFAQVLNNFQPADDDIGIEVTSHKALMRNYITGEANKPKGIRSSLTLNAGEFDSFKIGLETVITYSLKPFRACVQFAETFNLGVIINFESSGRPAVVVIRNPTFEANFIIATLNTNHATQSSLSSVVMSKKNKSVCGDKANLTVQDQQVLENVNWADDFNLPQKTDRFSDIMDTGRTNAEDILKSAQPKLGDTEVCNGEDDMILASPESPRSKRLKVIFGRCCESTFHPSMMLGEVLAPDSDPDSE